MKLAPISSDLLIKLALVAAGIGLAVYLVKRTTGAVSGAIDHALASAGEVADAVIEGVNPAAPGNVVNRGVTAIGSAIVSDTGPGRNADGSWTVGGWLYDLYHPQYKTYNGVFDKKSEETTADPLIYVGIA